MYVGEITNGFEALARTRIALDRGVKRCDDVNGATLSWQEFREANKNFLTYNRSGFLFIPK